MDIKHFLSPRDILLDVPIDDKTQLLKELSTRAAEATGLDPAVVAGEILKREGLGSTGIGNGVAIPHARIRGLIKAHGIFARLREPIEFDAIDERPVDLVFALLLPGSAESEQLNSLACVARKLRNAQVLEVMRSTMDVQTLAQTLLE